MNRDIKAFLVEEGSKLASDIIRMAVGRRVVSTPPPETTTAPVVSPATITTSPTFTPPGQPAEELDYRFECITKHIGGASVILREAFERANDEGVGEGTAEKIIEALNEHSAAESDLEKMLPIPEGRPIAEKLLSGIRQFRAAMWKAGLPTGGGTKDDIEDARLWNTIMLRETLDAVQEHPGETCIREGL